MLFAPRPRANSKENDKEGKNTSFADFRFTVVKCFQKMTALLPHNKCVRILLSVLCGWFILSVLFSLFLTQNFYIDPSLVEGVQQPYKMPKIIHQSWKSSNVVSYSSQGFFSYPFSKWIKSWIAYNPEWKYYFWTDEDNEKLFRETPELNRFLDVYLNKFNHIEKADFVRYAYLYVYGGVYADLDFECTHSLDYLALTFDAFLSAEPWEHSKALFNTDLTICNAILGSREKHPFWLFVLETSEALKRAGNCQGAVFCTGPSMLHKAYMEYSKEKVSLTKYTPDHITLLPSDLFYPKVAFNNIYELMVNCYKKGLFCGRSVISYPKKFAVHHWACTYCEKHSVQEVDIATLVPSENLVRPFSK
jgi:hypothetical protein